MLAPSRPERRELKFPIQATMSQWSIKITKLYVDRDVKHDWRCAIVNDGTGRRDDRERGCKGRKHYCFGSKLFGQRPRHRAPGLMNCFSDAYCSLPSHGFTFLSHQTHSWLTGTTLFPHHPHHPPLPNPNPNPSTPPRVPLLHLFPASRIRPCVGGRQNFVSQ
jgi:hypothetical protein